MIHVGIQKLVIITLKRLTMDNKTKQDNVPQVKTVEEYYPGIQYQELFDHMNNEHGLTLLQSQMDDIIGICGSMGSKQRIEELEKTVGIQDCAIAVLSDSVAELEAGLKQCQSDRDEFNAERDKYREALGVHDSWPVTDVLNKLVEATEYLLDVKNYDRVGWEEVSHCAKLGREYSTKILEALNSKEVENPNWRPAEKHRVESNDPPSRGYDSTN